MGSEFIGKLHHSHHVFGLVWGRGEEHGRIQEILSCVGIFRFLVMKS
jgi:hypothetical protein